MKFSLALVRTLPSKPLKDEQFFIERRSRYWIDAQAVLKYESLFNKVIKEAWGWVNPSK